MKRNRKKRPNDSFAAASHAAADWIARLKDDRSVPADEEGLDRWLSENPEHQETFDRINAIWDRCGDLQTHPLVVAEEIGSSDQKQTTESKKWFCGFFSASPLVKPLAAATAILLVISAIWFSQKGSFAPGTHATTYRSERGEQKSAILADGSTVLLDTTTTISADFSSGIRRVELIAGRVLFSVAHNPDKPFTVFARNTEVRVLGTEFDVAMQNGKITVAVLRGRVHVHQRSDWPNVNPASVRLSPDAKTSMQTVKESVPRSWEDTVDSQRFPVESREKVVSQIVTSGQEVVFDEKQRTFEVRPADVKRISAWRSGKLDFDRAPLADVITEINRYADQKIRIEDEDLNNIQISMVFKITDCNHFLSALEKTIPIVSRTSPDGKIMLTKREE